MEARHLSSEMWQYMERFPRYKGSETFTCKGHETRTTTELAITARLLSVVLEPTMIEYHCRFVALTSSDRTTDSYRWTITAGSWLQPAVIGMVVITIGSSNKPALIVHL